MTTAVLLSAAILLAAPPAPHGMGLIPPSRAELTQMKAKGMRYEAFAKGYKDIPPPRVELERMPRPHPAGQGLSSSCVGWAFGYAAKSYLEAVENQWSPNSPERYFSPAFIYSQRTNKASQNHDGMNPLEALVILREQGCATWAMMPFHQASADTPPSLEIQAKSFPYQIAGFMIADPPNSEKIKLMLANGMPVVLGIAVDEAFQALSGPEVYKAYDASKRLGFHAICAMGYDDGRQAIRLLNSWGDDWADRGYCWVHYDLFDKTEGEDRFCAFAVGLKDAPTVHLEAHVEPAGEKLYRWTTATTGRAESLRLVDSVEYSLPAGFTPDLVKRDDPGTSFALKSTDLTPSASDAPVELWVRLNTKGAGKTGPRPVIVPCGAPTAARGATASAGPGAVTLPDVRGSQPTEAVLRLLQMGLQPRLNRVPGEVFLKDVAPGQVAQQYPAPGTPLRRGTSITLFVNHQGR